MSPPCELSLSDSQVPTLTEVVWWQCSREWTALPIRTDVRGRAFLQDGDVSAHDISLAAEETWMLGPQARHLRCKDSGKAFWASAVFDHVVLQSTLLFTISVIQWVFSKICTIITSVVGCWMYRRGCCVHISATFSLDQFPSCLWFICISCCSCGVYSQCDTSPSPHRGMRHTGPFREL